uniref:Uncharacterized protein n=1 Tax=Rhizophora mucronata TaxID=61149 RepID=A0A2P2QLE0_RHIMU
MRQTGRPLESRLGLTSNPIHTIHSVQHSSSLPSAGRMVLSASSIGISQWNFGYNEERPSLVPETANQEVCISLAYCPSSDDIVATYRPKVEMSGEIAFSQPLLTPSATIGQGIWGSHLHFRRVGNNYEKFGSTCATVSDIRLPKSAIIDGEDQKPVFTAGDEITHQLVLQLLPSFIVAERLKAHKHFICDVKYTRAFNQGLLGCLSEETFQLFSRSLS